MLFRYRNFPKVPDKLIAEALEAIKGEDLRLNRELYSDRNDPGEQAGCICAFTEIPNLRKWFNKNIRPHLKDQERELHVQTIGTDVKPHKDPARRRVLNYLIDTGGDTVLTLHYKEDRKTMINAVQIEPFRWHELQTDVFHSVLGHERKRISLTYDVIKHWGKY